MRVGGIEPEESMNDYMRVEWYHLSGGDVHEMMNRQINARLDFIRSTSDATLIDVDFKTAGDDAIVVAFHYTAHTEITNWPRENG